MASSEQCNICSRYIGGEGRGNCEAYPTQEIPLEIWTGEHDHADPFKGDNGILYDPISNNEKPEDTKEDK
jgi:hypothetical protein